MKKNGFKIIVIVLIVIAVIIGGLLVVKNVKGDETDGKTKNGSVQNETEQSQDMQITYKTTEE